MLWELRGLGRGISAPVNLHVLDGKIKTSPQAKRHELSLQVTVKTIVTSLTIFTFFDYFHFFDYFGFFDYFQFFD